MASNPTLHDSTARLDVSVLDRREMSVGTLLRDICMPLASLRLTVVLFALGIALVLIGTLAQTEETILDVQNNYFHPWFSLVPIKVLFPQAWFPDLLPRVSGAHDASAATLRTGRVHAGDGGDGEHRPPWL